MKDNVSVLYDHQIFSMQDYGGISRLFVELIKEFNQDKEVQTFLSLIYSNNYYLEEIGQETTFFGGKKLPGRRKLISIINRLKSIRDISKNNFDILHPTYYDPYFLRFLGEKPYVLTVHDMTHELFPEGVSEKDKTPTWKKSVIPKAAKIITVSENTKKDLLKFYQYDESNISVIYHATSLKFINKKKDLKLPDKYILFVGNRSGYKNFTNLLYSCSELLKTDSDVYLLCAGGGRLSEAEQSNISELGLEGKVLQRQFSSNEELSLIYQNAIMFVFPSLYEGFGIPILEAMTCKCPLVLSDSSSLPEVALDAAVYFDPADEESMKEAILKTYKDDKLKKMLVEKASIRIKDFSWEKTAEKTKAVYTSLVSI